MTQAANLSLGPSRRRASPESGLAGNIDMTSGPSTEAALFVFAGGGTGGHLYPGLAVAEQLQKLLPSSFIHWAATPRMIDQRLLTEMGDAYIRQTVQPFSKNIRRWPSFYRAWRESCNFWDEFFNQHQVAAVLALGGYAAAPASRVANERKIPVALLNPDAKMGLANRYLARRATAIFTQWPMTMSGGGADLFNVTGVPLRASLFHRSREKSIAALGLVSDRQTLVITGASLGAGTINAAWCELMRDEEVLSELNHPQRPWQILHLTGTAEFAKVQQVASASGVAHWKVMDYCDDMGGVWAAADLAITRAGAGLCAELEACGVPAILMPYPFHRDRHQHANAEKLVLHGAAVMLEDRLEAAANGPPLKKLLLEMLRGDHRRQSMRAAALANGKPTAAVQIAKWLCRAAGRSIA